MCLKFDFGYFGFWESYLSVGVGFRSEFLTLTVGLIKLIVDSKQMGAQNLLFVTYNKVFPLSINLLQGLHFGFVVALTTLGFSGSEFVLEDVQLLLGDVKVEAERALVLFDIISVFRVSLALVNDNVDGGVGEEHASHAEAKDEANLLSANKTVLSRVSARIIVEITGTDFFSLEIATPQNGFLRGLNAAGEHYHHSEGRS